MSCFTASTSGSGAAGVLEGITGTSWAAVSLGAAVSAVLGTEDAPAGETDAAAVGGVASAVGLSGPGVAEGVTAGGAAGLAAGLAAATACGAARAARTTVAMGAAAVAVAAATCGVAVAGGGASWAVGVAVACVDVSAAVTARLAADVPPDGRAKRIPTTKPPTPTTSAAATATPTIIGPRRDDARVRSPWPVTGRAGGGTDATTGATEARSGGCTTGAGGSATLAGSGVRVARGNGSVATNRGGGGGVMVGCATATAAG
jgi:hypothetical protein